MLVAAHIKSKQPKNYGYYRVGAIRDLGGSHKLTPKMDPKLRVVRSLGEIFSHRLSLNDVTRVAGARREHEQDAREREDTHERELSSFFLA